MKNEDFEYKELEQLLKTKMNELSDSVDCFDKISARAFPTEDKDFSESGFTVSDLENITGQRQTPRILKWTAVAAAAVVGIAVIPKTGFMRRVLANLGSGSVKRNYQHIITEINNELEAGGYRIVDVPLEMYKEYDVLVTPNMSCPFEDCGKTDASVRLYIKQIQGCDTNQIYAVEYAGTYSENNIIAAAEPVFKFTEDECNAVYDIKGINDNVVYNLSTKFGTSDRAANMFGIGMDGEIFDAEGNRVYLASFACASIIKTKETTEYVTTDVIYGHNADDDTNYFYDIMNRTDSGAAELPEREEMWKRSLYFNGNSAMPKRTDDTDKIVSQTSKMKQTPLYDKISDEKNMWWVEYVMPSVMGTYAPTVSETLTAYESASKSVICTIIPPVDTTASCKLKMYLCGHDTEDHSVTIQSDSSDFKAVLTDQSISVDNSESDTNKLMLDRARLISKLSAVQANIESVSENSEKNDSTYRDLLEEQTRLVKLIEKVDDMMKRISEAQEMQTESDEAEKAEFVHKALEAAEREALNREIAEEESNLVREKDALNTAADAFGRENVPSGRLE